MLERWPYAVGLELHRRILVGLAKISDMEYKQAAPHVHLQPPVLPSLDPPMDAALSSRSDTADSELGLRAAARGPQRRDPSIFEPCVVSLRLSFQELEFWYGAWEPGCRVLGQ
jgi:hypothetical protein